MKGAAKEPLHSMLMMTGTAKMKKLTTESKLTTMVEVKKQLPLDPGTVYDNQPKKGGGGAKQGGRVVPKLENQYENVGKLEKQYENVGKLENQYEQVGKKSLKLAGSKSQMEKMVAVGTMKRVSDPQRGTYYYVPIKKKALLMAPSLAPTDSVALVKKPSDSQAETTVDKSRSIAPPGDERESRRSCRVKRGEDDSRSRRHPDEDDIDRSRSQTDPYRKKSPYQKRDPPSKNRSSPNGSPPSRKSWYQRMRPGSNRKSCMQRHPCCFWTSILTAILIVIGGSIAAIYFIVQGAMETTPAPAPEPVHATTSTAGITTIIAATTTPEPEPPEPTTTPTTTKETTTPTTTMATTTTISTVATTTSMESTTVYKSETTVISTISTSDSTLSISAGDSTTTESTTTTTVAL